MIKIEEKTKIIVIDGEPGMLLLEFAVITRDLKKILPKGFAEKLEEDFKIGMTAKVEGEVGRRMSRLVHGEPRVLSKKEVEDGIEAVIKALMEEIGVDESDGE